MGRGAQRPKWPGPVIRRERVGAAHLPLVDHHGDHVLDQDDINTIVAPTLTGTVSKTVLPGRIRAAQKRS